MPVNDKPASPPRLRVLLAEDILVPETQMMRMLGKLGHHVTRVNTGSEALAYAVTRRFDLAFMDLKLPRMDAVTIARAIRAHEHSAHKHIRLIAMSTRSVASDRNRCLAAGIDLYISKPLSIAELVIVLQAFRDPDSIEHIKRTPDWDRATTLERAGGDEKSLHALMEIFARDKPALLASMNRALRSEEGALLERTALRLGEELSYVGAAKLSRTARQLALFGRNGDFGNASKLAVALQSQLSQMDSLLARGNR